MDRKDHIKKLLETLNIGLHEREEAIAVALLGALSGENTFLLGPPGTAKSLISRRLADIFKEIEYFEYLMQRFSTPEEIFGPISIKSLKEDKFERQTKHYLPEAHFAFLDEIWKAGSAILNSLLTVINEKKFKNGTQVVDVPMLSLIVASNEIPQDSSLEAMYDRFILRVFVSLIENKEKFGQYLQDSPMSFEVPTDIKISLDEAKKWQKEIDSITVPNQIINAIHHLRIQIEEHNKENSEDLIYISDRRWKKAIHILKASAFFSEREEVSIVDTLLLNYCLWSNDTNRAILKDLIQESLVVYITIPKSDDFQFTKELEVFLSKNHKQTSGAFIVNNTTLNFPIKGVLLENGKPTGYKYEITSEITIDIIKDGDTPLTKTLTADLEYSKLLTENKELSKKINKYVELLRDDFDQVKESMDSLFVVDDLKDFIWEELQEKLEIWESKKIELEKIADKLKKNTGK